LVDAHGSGPCVREDVLVRIQSRVHESRQMSAFFIYLVKFYYENIID